MPSPVQLINNQAFSWSSIRTVMFGRSIVGFDAINYEDNQKAKGVKGRGNIPYTSITGGYETVASISLHMGEIIGIQRAAPPGTRIQDIEPFDIVVSYNQGGFLVKDILRGCRFLKNSRDGKGDGLDELKSKMDLFVLSIDWDVV